MRALPLHIVSALLAGCSSPVLTALSDTSVRDKLVAEIPGEPVEGGGLSVVAEPNGISLYVSVFDGPNRRIWKRAFSTDGLTFDKPEDVASPDSPIQLYDVSRDGDTYRAIWAEATTVHAASSSDGLGFKDDGAIEVADLTQAPFASRLVASDGAFNLYFARDNSTPCGDQLCAHISLDHASASSPTQFSNADDVEANPAPTDTCGSCGADAWLLAGVARPAVESCRADGTVLLAEHAFARFVAISLGGDGATLRSADELPADLEPAHTIGTSPAALVTDRTIAVFSASCENDCNSPPVTGVTVSIVEAPEQARLHCGL